MKRTKIICTIGPASESILILRKMIRAGMNYARLNLSHADHAYHARLIKNIRAAARLEGELVGIIADLQGPKIRLGKLPKEGVELKLNTLVTLVPTPSARASRAGLELPVTYKEMYKDVRKDNRILIDDGLIELKVEKVSGRKIVAQVTTPGRVTSNKGINLPDSKVRLRSLTDKDRRDVNFAIKQKVEWIALSFVRNEIDVKDLRKLLRGRPQKIIAKIEKGEALRNFDKILKVVDGVMVARGDLGVEVAAERVPLAQKDIIRKCLLSGKPVIIATQMLDSMIRNPRPTRAEVSDVAGAIVEHADAIMLSGETATGKYPLEAVTIMGKIAVQTEKSKYDNLEIASFGHRHGLYLATAEAVLHLAKESGARLIFITSPASAELAQTISHFRQEVLVVPKVSDAFLAAQVNLNWGVAAITKIINLSRFCHKGDDILIIDELNKGQVNISIKKVPRN